VLGDDKKDDNLETRLYESRLQLRKLAMGHHFYMGYS